MTRVKMHAAKTNFSRLIHEVERGSEIIVQRGETPVAKIVPYEGEGRARKFGALKGQFKQADDFDALPEGFGEYVG
jgi:prevent-host-death family protein